MSEAPSAARERRKSSFAASSSPWVRRNSFLSPSMIQNEDFSVYDSPSYLPESASYSIISLKQSQGFIFNQDLFASPYQQSRSLANERRIRALSFSRRSTSSMVIRRHTSYHSQRPVLHGSVSDIAVDDSDHREDSTDEDITQDTSQDTNDKEHTIEEHSDDVSMYSFDDSSRYTVQVTEIEINENDCDIFPQNESK